MEAHERRALPEGWEWKGLGEILELIRNGISTKQNEEKEGYPVTRIETISKGKINREKIGYVREDYNIILKYKMISGDILFSHINSAEHIGKTAIFENELDELYQGVNLLLLRPNKDIVFPKYLLFYLKEPEVRKYFETRCKKAVNQASLNQKDIIQIKIPLPPLPTQRRIVSILEKAEETKKLRAQADELTERLLQSVFLEMFGDPAKNPKGWELKKAEEICSKEKNAIKAGPFGSSLKKEIYVESGYKIYGQEQVISDDLTFGNYYISEEKYKDFENYKIQEGDILISLVGSYGKISIVPKGFEPGIINPRLMKISLNKEIIHPIYFKNLFLSKAIVAQVKNLSHGGTMDIINIGIVKQLLFQVPPLPLQQKFARLVEKIEAMRQSQNQSKQQIEDLFSALMQKAFRGEI